MLRGAPQASAQDNKQQKQKKRLSFREPEVEGPQRNYFYGAKSKTLARPATKPQTNARKTSASVEDLTLEDQALLIAQDVGSAFSYLTITDRVLQQADPRVTDLVDTERETEIRDSSPVEFAACQRNCQLRSFKITAEDEEFLDSIVPPISDSAMRGPSFESGDRNPDKNGIPGSEPPSREEDRWPGPSGTSIQHQVQLLRYQLEQQNQQTQMAMHQIQLLQDRADAESAARKKAQEQNNQLMQQNKELLNHIEKLFQQIEELERQVQIHEQEKRGRRVAANPESQVASVRQTSSYSMNRRPSTELTNEKPTMQARSFSATRKSSLTSTKPLSTIPKISTVQNPTSASLARKTPTISSKPSTVPSKFKDSGTKEKETLRIGDTSPPVQSGTTSPFSSAWKIKSPDNSTLSNADKTGDGARSRTGSFSSYIKKPQESGTAKSTLFGSSSLTSTSITGKKHSSSTSDLYNPPSSFQGKSSLMIDEPPTSVKSAISNLSISSISKLPRYQPYTGWQRRTSLTGEGDQVSAISKDSYKSSPQTSLFNR